MIIGVPKEIKPDEYRVGIVASGVEALCAESHKVLIQKDAGKSSGISNAEYRRCGAIISNSAREIYRKADMIIKVKEPYGPEYDMVRPGQIVFTYFHFAASRKLTLAMKKAKIKAVAYETIETDHGTRPLLTPMSEVAGRMSIQEGAKYLERPMMGRGILLGGVPGVEPAEVVILGGGIVGGNAAKIAAGLGARVTILEINLDRMRYLDDIMPKNVTTVMSNPLTIREYLRRADLVIGATLIAGARTPKLVKKEDLKNMKPGAVIVDVAIDQGGCFETSRPTTHLKPTYTVNGILHYCVANIPGAVARTSTYALTNVTLPYARMIAAEGLETVARKHPPIRKGINLYEGKITCEAIAQAHKIKFEPMRLPT